MTLRIEEYNLLIEIQKFLSAEGSHLDLASALLSVINRLGADRALQYNLEEKFVVNAANEKPLMQLLLDAGYPISEMDHHASDLYVYVTPVTTEVITKWCRRHGFSRSFACPTFTDQITGKRMYDCGFQWSENLAKEVTNRER